MDDALSFPPSSSLCPPFSRGYMLKRDDVSGCLWVYKCKEKQLKTAVELGISLERLLQNFTEMAQSCHIGHVLFMFFMRYMGPWDILILPISIQTGWDDAKIPVKSPKKSATLNRKIFSMTKGMPTIFLPFSHLNMFMITFEKSPNFIRTKDRHRITYVLAS